MPSKSMPCPLQSVCTSSSVNPTYEAYAEGSSMVYSWKSESADCVPYFFMGNIPVMYAAATASCVNLC